MDKIKPLIIKNFSSLFIAQIVYKVFAFFAYALIARSLGAAGFGQFSFALSFVGLFAVCLDFGFNELLIRDAAGRIDELGNKYISNILSIKLMLSVVTYLFLALIASLISQNAQVRNLILILGICLALDSFTVFFRSIFRLFEKMEFEALSLVSEAILKLAVIFLVFRIFAARPVNIGYALLSISCATFIIVLFLCKLKFLKLKFSIDYVFATRLFKKAVPFAFLTFFGVINFKIVIVMISYLFTDASAGRYSAATRIIEPILIIPVMIATVLFPTMSRIHKSSKNAVIDLCKKSSKILFWLGILFVLGLNIFAVKLISLAFGKEYLNSVILLRILTISLIPFFLKFLLERFLLVLGKPGAVIWGYMFGTLIMVSAGFLFIKFTGDIGAAIAMAFSEFFIVGFNLFSIRAAVV